MPSDETFYSGGARVKKAFVQIVFASVCAGIACGGQAEGIRDPQCLARRNQHGPHNTVFLRDRSEDRPTRFCRCGRRSPFRWLAGDCGELSGNDATAYGCFGVRVFANNEYGPHDVNTKGYKRSSRQCGGKSTFLIWQCRSERQPSTDRLVDLPMTESNTRRGVPVPGSGQLSMEYRSKPARAAMAGHPTKSCPFGFTLRQMGGLWYGPEWSGVLVHDRSSYTRRQPFTSRSPDV